MVRFTNSTAPETSQSPALNDMLQTAIDNLADELRELHIHVDVEVDASLAKISYPSSIENALSSLLSRAIAGIPIGSEMSVSACRTNRGVEIEIANGSPLLNDGPANAFSRCVWRESNGDLASRMQPVTAAGCELYHTRCPQGGQAWTLVLVSRMIAVRAA